MRSVPPLHQELKKEPVSKEDIERLCITIDHLTSVILDELKHQNQILMGISNKIGDK